MALAQDFSGAATGATSGAIATGGNPIGAAVGGGVGLLAGIFSSNDDADQAQSNIQKAVAQYDNLGVPPNESMPLILQQLQVGGKLTPAYEQALQSVGASQVQENPGDRQSILSTLSALHGMTQGGLNPEQMANAQKLQGQVDSNTQSQIKNLMQNQAQQGKSGSGDTLAAELSAVQGGAQNQSQAAANIGAQGFQAQQGALQQLLSGQGNLRNQDIGEATTNAQLKQQADLYNAQNSASRQARNVASENTANEANWGRQNQVGDTNSLMANQEQQREANATQTNWEDQLQAAQGKANAYTGAAGVYGNMANNANQSFNQGLQGVGTLAAAYGNYKNKQGSSDAATNPYASGSLNENGLYEANGGMIPYYAEGGQVQQPDPMIATNAPMTPVNPINLSQFGDEGPMNKNASMNTQANMMNMYAGGGEVKADDSNTYQDYLSKKIVPDDASAIFSRPAVYKVPADEGYRPAKPIWLAKGGAVTQAPMVQPVTLNSYGAYANGGEVQAQDMKNVAEDGRAQPQNARQFMNMYAAGGPVQFNGSQYDHDVMRSQQKAGTMYASGGHINFTGGGPVPGTPKFPGNNYANDVVPAMVSPGEIVVPNSASHDPEKAKQFVEDEIYNQHAKMHGPVFQRLHERLKKVEGKKGNK